MTTVRRVQTADGTTVDPHLQAHWSPLEQLRWHAAVVNLDCDLHITVEPHAGRDDEFLVCGLRCSHGPLDFHDAWKFLNGVSFGARLADRRR